MKITILLYLTIIMILSGCESPTMKHEKAQQALKASSRFICSDEQQFDCKSGSMEICTDKLTGIKYLYLWGGMGNGGPAITRLWEK